MQNHNRSLTPSLLDQAFARARKALDGDPTEPAAPLDPPAADECGGDERATEPLLDGAEVLRVLREPVEWVLSLAQRLADDSADVAAIARVRAAFFARLAGQPARIRKTDVLIVIGLLIGAFDPSVVVRAVSNTFGESIAAVLGPEPTIAFHVAGTIDPFADLLAALRALRSTEPRSGWSRRSLFR